MWIIYVLAGLLLLTGIPALIWCIKVIRDSARDGWYKIMRMIGW